MITTAWRLRRRPVLNPSTFRAVLERLDEIPFALFTRRRGTPWPHAWPDVARHANDVGLTVIHDRLVKLGEALDRMFGYQLTASAFVVAIGGFSIAGRGSELSLQVLMASWAGALGVLAFLFTLRGTTRRIDRGDQLVREIDEKGLERQLGVLHRKNAWGWLGGLMLWPAVVLLGVASLLNGVVGG